MGLRLPLQVESFNGRLRDERLNAEVFFSGAETRVVVEKRRRHYNEERPHSALGYPTPAEAARASLENPQNR